MKAKFKTGDKVRVIRTSADAESAVIGDIGTVVGIHNGYSLPIVVKFEVKRKGFHTGLSRGYRFADQTCYYCREEMLEKLNECIVVYRKGDETVALDKTTGTKAVAKCSPDDTYDFYTGARLAFDRLVKPPVKEVKRAAKAGEYVKVVEVSNDTPEGCYEKGDILKIIAVDSYMAKYGRGSGEYLYKSEYVVLEGYAPEETEKKEPEKQPYNGKVVCIETKFPNLTKGKIYEVVDGVLTYDDGAESCVYFSFKDLKIGFTSKFIEIVE